MSEVTLRDGLASDAPALLEIYRPIVEQTTISFELEPPGTDEFAARIEKAVAGYAWLVADIDGRPAGYAYATSFRAREAYRHSVETTVYVDPGRRGGRVGSVLYQELFCRLGRLGYVSAFAGITLPNEASVAFHEANGFSAIGVFPKAGFKFDRWCDVGFWYRPLPTP